MCHFKKMIELITSLHH